MLSINSRLFTISYLRNSPPALVVNTGKLTQSILFTRHGNGLRVSFTKFWLRKWLFVILLSVAGAGAALWLHSSFLQHPNTLLWLVNTLNTLLWLVNTRSQGMSNIRQPGIAREDARWDQFIICIKRIPPVNSFSLISTWAWDWIKLCRCQVQVLIWKVHKGQFVIRRIR